MDKLPPFSSGDKRQHAAMIKWVHGVLDEYFSEYYYYDELSKAEDECHKNGWFTKVGLFSLPRVEQPGAIKAARQGEVKYLRKLYPEIAEFIQPPRLEKGQRPSCPPRWGDVRETAKIVRRIWQAYYRRSRRRADDGPSAEEIAAKYHGLDATVIPWKEPGKTGKKKL